MARSRNIKPGFFKNEALAEMPFEARLLFAGLWTLADREGRLEDRPKRIKAEIFPYEEVDVDHHLSGLAQAGFIERYTLAGNEFISIPSFLKHQNPHKKEAASTIPAPDQHQASTVLAPGKNSPSTGNSGTSPADSLSSDSLNLIPSSAAKIAADCDVAAETFDLGDDERAEVWNSHGSGNSKTPSKKSKKLLLSPEIESALALAAVRIRARHPALQRCALAEVKTKLRAILKLASHGKRLEVLRRVDENHAAWCAHPKWQEENGQYVKGLEKWLAEPEGGRWEVSPPSLSARDSQDGYRPVSEWDRAS